MTADIKFSGNLTRDPELRFTNSGKAVVSFGVAVNRRYQVNGEWQEQVSFFNCTAWDELGENIAASCHKGTRLIVEGRIEQRTYQNNAGENVTTFDVICQEAGPSLRWATCEISKTNRSSAPPPPEHPGEAAPASAGTRAAKPQAEPYYGGDEEPF